MPEPLRSGLKTTLFLDDDRPCLIVRSIAWDSGFRASGLKVGDGIVAIDGVSVREPSNSELERTVGQWNESTGFEERNAKDGDPFRLRVRRRQSPGHGWIELEMTGSLRAERQWREAAGPVYGPGGPPHRANDEFDSPWGSWYERQARAFEGILNWHEPFDTGALGTVQTRMTLEAHLKEKQRVQYAVDRYPGPFSDALQEDWETVKQVLEGDRIELPQGALDFRNYSDRRKEQTELAAANYWNSASEELRAEIIPFPEVDPFRGNIAPLVGKLVVLPPIDQRRWIVDMGRAYLAWRQGVSCLVAPIDSPSIKRVLAAIGRYEKLVTPSIRLEMALIGRIMPNPRLIASHGRAIVGLEVEPVVVLVDEAVCVDTRRDDDGTSPFAGESEVQQLAQGPPPDNATPREIMEAMIAAVKRTDQQTWSALFTEWRAEPFRNRPVYYPVDSWGVRASAWVDSRRALMDRGTRRPRSMDRRSKTDHPWRRSARLGPDRTGDRRARTRRALRRRSQNL